MPAFQYENENDMPPATRVTDTAISRYAGTYEVAPELMVEHITQQTFPNWDTLRIIESRADHLAWMHEHWADRVISGAELLADLDVAGTD